MYPCTSIIVLVSPVVASVSFVTKFPVIGAAEFAVTALVSSTATGAFPVVNFVYADKVLSESVTLITAYLRVSPTAVGLLCA